MPLYSNGKVLILPSSLYCLLVTKVDRPHVRTSVKYADRTDVVPVLEATRGMWTHDPYGGEYDEKTGLIWGRGSSDDKSGTIGAL